MRECKHEGCTNPSRVHAGSTHRDCTSCQNIKRKFGITTPVRDAMLDEQDGKCAICMKPIEFRTGGACIDHQEHPFKIRGILCISCNTGLGKLGDNEEGLLRALEYVRRD